MDTDLSLQRFGLVPDDAHLPCIRDILEREAEAERKGHERVEDLALLCCVQLFSRGKLEDVLRIWSAKRAGMDLGVSLDVQLLCGAGLQQTKSWLATQASAMAADALQYLQECELAGDFSEFTPAGHLDHYRRYFNVG